MTGGNHIVIGRKIADTVQIVFQAAPDFDAPFIGGTQAMHFSDKQGLVFRGAAPVVLPLNGTMERDAEGTQACRFSGQNHLFRCIRSIVKAGMTMKILPDHKDHSANWYNNIY